MPGRHRATPLPPRLGRRRLAGVAGAAIVGATLLAFSSASATTTAVRATFGVTGVATTGCPVSVGGTDVYVQPGQDLDVHSSLAGITVLGSPLDSSKIVSLAGSFTIDARSIPLTGDWKTLSWAKRGDHRWHWRVDAVTLLNVLNVPVTYSLGEDNVSAGAQLAWSGTIHVTSDRTRCGIAVQLPSASASVSVHGLPPIAVGIPGAHVSLPVNLPQSSPVGGDGSRANGDHTGRPPPAGAGNPVPVPAQVVPGVTGGGLLGGGNYGPGVLPDAGSGRGGAADEPAAGNLARQDGTSRHKTIDLASGKASSTGEVWVVLAIVAVIALAFVAATYARLYLRKPGSPES